MIQVLVAINSFHLAELGAVRIEPTNANPEIGELCRYQLRYRGEDVGEMNFPYGNAIDMAKAMLDRFARDKDIIIATYQIKVAKRVHKFVEDDNDFYHLKKD